jgi:hypothetical protein
MVFIGEVSEWLMVHPWKGCVEQSTVGSNPILSASYTKLQMHLWRICSFDNDREKNSQRKTIEIVFLIPPGA